MHPGGMQAQMQDGWFICDGERIIQSMVFLPDHPTYSDQPKGIWQVLVERGIFSNKLCMQCKDDCTSNSCCAKHILELQPDFKEQKSLVQEVIEVAGHLCIFLHFELNYIEFFWGAVKQWLCENCDYTFQGLQENLPKALNSVALETIQKWEHQMYHWMDAYRNGLSACDAQFKVKEFSSKKYSSHQQVPESLARQFD